MLESYAFYVIVTGALLGVAGFLWLVARAFGQRVGWGVALVVFPPAGLLFIARHSRAAKGPARLLALAAAVVATPYAVSYYERHFVPLRPFEQIVDGEFRVTLTGLKDFDYSTLNERPRVVVLQMANADVDDRTLEHLKGLTELRELDLNGTQVTDAGLAVVAGLPQLRTLRLARTRITDEGFRTHLFPKESLTRLDLTGTDVKGKTKRDWKKQKPEVREYVD
jgi:hypothetical protein